jgi:ABC-2 type transport system permease protein
MTRKKRQNILDETIPVYDTAKRRIVAVFELVQAWNYRDLIWQLVRRDVTSRYKRSVLGIAWTMLNPLGTMIVMTIVFSQLFSRIEGYSAYLLSGLVIWQFFSQSSSSGINNLVRGGPMFTRIYVPRTAFALSSVGTGLVNLSLTMVVLFGVMAVVGVSITWASFLVVVPMMLTAIFSLGMSLLISSAGIFFDDVVQMYNILLRAWMYFTPIIYQIDILPDFAQRLMFFNPVYHFVELMRKCTYFGEIFTWQELGWGALFAFVPLIIGWLVFARISEQLAYRT